MLHIYGSPISSPTNKVRYIASYLGIPHEFHAINLGAGEHRTPAFLKMNPIGKIPAIDDDGFHLAESNAIVRYLADKHKSKLYPQDLQQRARIDQWIDFASMHVMMALSKIMYNTYFYKFSGAAIDERSLQDGRQFIGQHLPIVEQQLSQHAYIAGENKSLADIVMLAALDVSEMANVDLTAYPHIVAWRKTLMSEKFYTDCHESYSTAFTKILSARSKVT